MMDFEIVQYEARYKDDFRRLNLEWLDKYGLTESHDLEILDDPEGNVISKGGCIFIAKNGEQVVGSAGLFKDSDNAFELVKMAVEPAIRRTGLGKLLLEKCIKEAKDRNAERIFLFSNSQLKAALNLYEKYGFRYVEATNAPFVTADIKMELTI